MNWFFNHFGWFVLLGIVAIICVVVFEFQSDKEDEKQYRQDCLENHGKMIGDTCFMPNYTAVEKKDDGNTTVILVK